MKAFQNKFYHVFYKKKCEYVKCSKVIRKVGEGGGVKGGPYTRINN